MILSTIIALATLAPPAPKVEMEVLGPGDSVLVDTATGEIVGIKPGTSDATCNPILLYEVVDGVKVLVSIRCDYLPTCKPRNCGKHTKDTGLPGIVEVWCECE